MKRTRQLAHKTTATSSTNVHPINLLPRCSIAPVHAAPPLPSLLRIRHPALRLKLNHRPEGAAGGVSGVASQTHRALTRVYLAPTLHISAEFSHAMLRGCQVNLEHQYVVGA
eukprot:50711-Eustigmatos_ZCMA.PRE.1